MRTRNLSRMSTESYPYGIHIWSNLLDFSVDGVAKGLGPIRKVRIKFYYWAMAKNLRTFFQKKPLK